MGVVWLNDHWWSGRADIETRETGLLVARKRRLDVIVKVREVCVAGGPGEEEES